MRLGRFLGLLAATGLLCALGPAPVRGGGGGGGGSGGAATGGEVLPAAGVATPPVWPTGTPHDASAPSAPEPFELSVWDLIDGALSFPPSYWRLVAGTSTYDHVLCEGKFIASLEVMAEALSMSDDVAGATLMAAGTSATEFFVSLVGVFMAANNPGPATIMGSAIFNLCIIVGGSGLICGYKDGVALDWYVVLRDSFCCAVATVEIWFLHGKDAILWYDSLLLVVTYILYIILMKYNYRIRHFLRSHKIGWDPPEEREDKQAEKEKKPGVEAVPGIEVSPAAAAAAAAAAQSMQRPQFLTVPRGGGSAARLAVSHYIPAPPLDAPPQPLIFRAHSVHTPDPRTGGTLVTELPPVLPAFLRSTKGLFGRRVGDDEEEDEEETPLAGPSQVQESDRPNTPLRWVLYILALPFLVAFRFTVPNPNSRRWRRFFFVSFFSCIIWLGVITFLMVDTASKFGDCTHMSTNLIGLTVLAVGTSLPDCISSLFAAKHGHPRMAVSNALGSNTFDLLFALGVPFLLYSIVHPGAAVKMSESGMVTYAVTLLFMLFLWVLAVGLCKWTLKRWICVMLLVAYAVFLGVAVFGSVDNKAMEKFEKYLHIQSIFS